MRVSSQQQGEQLVSTTNSTTQDALRPRDLATLANEINDHHDRATEAARTAIEHVRECGELLIQAKAQLGHGGFLGWLKANCRVKPRQSRDACVFSVHREVDPVWQRAFIQSLDDWYAGKGPWPCPDLLGEDVGGTRKSRVTF